MGKPRINNAEPVGIITAKNKLTGKTFQFKAPGAIAKTLKVGDPVYAQPVNDIRIDNSEPINDFAIVQSSYGSSNGQMASYGYGATSGDNTNTGNGTSTDKWVITPVTNMKGVLGKLDMNFPAGVDWNIFIRRPADNEFITSFSSTSSRKEKFYNITPGEYRILLSNALVENVPIQKGNETRLKAGFLNVVSESQWSLRDETKEHFITSNPKPQKIALPVGNYQLNLGGQFHSVAIKDGETVEL